MRTHLDTIRVGLENKDNIKSEVQNKSQRQSKRKTRDARSQTPQTILIKPISVCDGQTRQLNSLSQ